MRSGRLESKRGETALRGGGGLPEQSPRVQGRVTRPAGPGVEREEWGAGVTAQKLAPAAAGYVQVRARAQARALALGKDRGRGGRIRGGGGESPLCCDDRGSGSSGISVPLPPLPLSIWGAGVRGVISGGTEARLRPVRQDQVAPVTRDHEDPARGPETVPVCFPQRPDPAGRHPPRQPYSVGELLRAHGWGPHGQVRHPVLVEVQHRQGRAEPT